MDASRRIGARFKVEHSVLKMANVIRSREVKAGGRKFTIDEIFGSTGAEQLSTWKDLH